MIRTDLERASEWPILRLGIVVASVTALLFLAVGSAAALLDDEPARIDLVEQCLRREKLLEVRRLTTDPIAATASGGALATRVEGNGVHIAVASSAAEVARVVALYQAVAGSLAGRLESRGVLVYLWEGVTTPTQRQTMYDCVY